MISGRTTHTSKGLSGLGVWFSHLRRSGERCCPISQTSSSYSYTAFSYFFDTYMGEEFPQ